MLTIWGRLNSHNVKKVAWLAQEIGLPHRRIDMGGTFGFTAEYLAMNPNRMIPSISVEGGPDDGLNLWESNAILRYMAARHAPTLWPAPTRRCARGATAGWTGSSTLPTRSAMPSSAMSATPPRHATGRRLRPAPLPPTP